jgi:UDP-glucose 4-epimerase
MKGPHMKMVVTGGAGFIGANLCRRLAATEGVNEVVAFDNLSTGFRSNLDGVDARLVEASILDPDALDAALDGAWAVIHLGARGSVPRSVAEPIASHQANATGTVQVLEAARRAGDVYVVVSSSSSVYGANTTLPKVEDMVVRPVSPYAASKLAAESYTLAWQHTYGLPTLAFRFFNVFGPLQPAWHDYAAVVPAFLAAALHGRPLPVHGDGTQSRDFTFVDSVCEVVTRAAVDRVVSDIPVNLAFGSRISLLDVIDVLQDLLGHPLEVDHLPARAGDVRHTQADNSRLRELFPDITPVSLRDGLASTIEWFRTQPDEGPSPAPR